MNTDKTSGATLIAHCGARKVTRDELKDFPVPEATRTHKPVAHFEIVKTLEEALSFRFLNVVRDEYAVSSDGMKMFGVMDLDSEFSGCRFSIGLRNSNDKSMRLAMTAGLRVMVCDNMAFSGDFTPLSHKHTRNLQLSDSISIAVDRIHRGFEPLKEQVEAMKALGLNDAVAKLVIYQAFMDRKIRGLPKHLMSVVHKFYFKPEYKAFEPRTLWSLSNAFTSALKKLAPLKQFETTARLGTFLTDVQDDLDQKLNLNLGHKENGRSNISLNSRTGISGSPNPSDSDYEDFDEDDIAEDPEKEFDEYFDEEEELETLERAEDELMEEYMRKVA